MANSRDEAGFCKLAKLAEIKKHGHILTLGRYVGTAEIEEGDETFEDKMKRLTDELSEQFEKADKLEADIKKNLKGLGYNIV